MEKQAPAELFALDHLKAGDDRAWNAAFKCFYNLAFNVLEAVFHSLPEADLQDVVQEAIVSLINKYVQDAESVDDLKKLVVTIAKNEARDLIRHRKTQKGGQGKVDSLEELASEKGFDIPDETIPPDELTQKVERALLIQEAVKQIPPKYGDVLTDHYFLGLSHKEIADKRGLKIGSVGVYLTRGKELLAPIFKNMSLL